MDYQIGDTLSQTFVVGQNQTAKFYGSGNLEVFATPSMIACMENTAMKLLQKYLPDGMDSVGTEISEKHLKASAVGETILFEAILTGFENKKVLFEVIATNQEKICIGTATHTRYIIDVQFFMNKLKAK